MLKGVITDEEYDRLNMWDQAKYRWCEKHQIFWCRDFFVSCPVVIKVGGSK